MIYIILPIAFFVLTLIIILVLRAEDRKSRNLQLVNKQIASFRSETQATISRIQTTSNDVKEGLYHKINEVKDAETSLLNTLSQLQQRSHDLIALEDVCTNYKVALENLKLQTEQAEARIGAVQKQVAQAEIIHSVVDQFKADSLRSENYFKQIVQNYNELVTNTEKALIDKGEEQKERNDEMLTSFNSDLAIAKTEFDNYVLSEHEKVREERDSYLEDVKNAEASFVEKQNQLELEVISKLEIIEDKHNQVLASIGQEKETLGKLNDEYETEYSNCLETLQEQVDVFKQSIENGKDNLNSTYDGLLSNLMDQKAGVDDLIESKLQEVGQSFDGQMQYIAEEKTKQQASFEEGEQILKLKLQELENTSDSFKQDADNAKEEMEANFNMLKQDTQKIVDEINTQVLSAQDKLNEDKEKILTTFDAQLTTFKEKLVAEEEAFRVFVADLEKDLDSKIEVTKADYDSCEIKIKGTVCQMSENAEQALQDYQKEVTVALSKAFKDELDKVDANFLLQKQQITTMLETMLSRQTDMRELSVRLGQGVDNTIRSAMEKLQNLQTRIDSSMLVLKTTQEEVSKTKEKLFDYKREAVEISSKLKSRIAEPEKELPKTIVKEVEPIEDEFSTEEEDLLSNDEDK